MLDYTRFRYRRGLRRFRRDIRIFRVWLFNYVNRNIINKWHQLGLVRGFLLKWLCLFVVLAIGVTQQTLALARDGQVSVPTAGGTYTEAAIGKVKAINPVLPDSSASRDVSRLIFSGLTRYDNHRKLVGDLAESWSVSADNRVFTFKLRHDVRWHDGVPFTADDVVFTILAIQTPDTRSPLASSWQDVKTEAKDDYTVTFTLTTPLASFMDSTTVGIIPRHVLETVDPSTLRENQFNQYPVGTGPFKMKTYAPSAGEILLSAYDRYHFGRPKIDEFIFKLYDDADEAIAAYAQQQVTALGQAAPDHQNHVVKLTDLNLYDYTLPEETVLFFNNADATLADKTLRSILSRALSRSDIASAAAGDSARPVTQPLLPGQAGYTSKYAPIALTVDAAKAALDAAGWKTVAGRPAREKADKKLEISLVTLAGGELERAAKEIQKQYAAIGVVVNLKTVGLDQLQQTNMRPRNFQMLLYGVNVGADPDVYAYWHSSQAKDPGVNLSSYSSADADKALEAGRVKSDPAIRRAKYDAFLKAWNADAPAAVLYQGVYRYGVRDTVAGPLGGRLGIAADRFYRVERWTVRRTLVPRAGS